jgi:hypothetical protein
MICGSTEQFKYAPYYFGISNIDIQEQALTSPTRQMSIGRSLIKQNSPDNDKYMTCRLLIYTDFP